MSCLTCGSETSNPKYCSRSCSAAQTNRLNPKRRKETLCKRCKTPIYSNRTFCSDCWKEVKDWRVSEKVSSWLSGAWRGGTDHGLSDTIKKYLLETAKMSCSKCGFNTPHSADGRTILEINHKDGDGTNHSPENLEVLCPNCHALTESYRGRNYGRGKRKYHYLRVSKD